MENAIKFLFKLFGCMVFIIAITNYLTMYRSLQNVQVNLKYYNQNRTISQKESPPVEMYATGGDILNAIYRGLETDIEIDGYMVNRQSDITQIDISKIDLQGKYKRKINIVDGIVNKVYYYKN